MAKRLSKPASKQPVALRREARFRSQDIQKAIFESQPRKKTLNELKDGVRLAIRKRHAPG